MGLVLTRKKDETFRIGKDITIRVVRIAGDRVRLWIAAPTNIEIVRAEIDVARAAQAAKGAKAVQHG